MEVYEGEDYIVKEIRVASIMEESNAIQLMNNDSDTLDPIGEALNQLNIKETTGQENPVSIGTRAVAKPDLWVATFAFNSDAYVYPRPWPSHVTLPIALEIKNIGDATAHDIVVDMKIDGVAKGYNGHYDSLEPGESLVGILPYRGIVIGEYGTAGYHTIETYVSCGSSESNYSNNSARIYDEWVDMVDLSPTAIYAEDGLTTWNAMTDKRLVYEVANIGWRDLDGDIDLRLDLGVGARKEKIFEGTLDVNIPRQYTLTFISTLQIKHKVAQGLFTFKSSCDNDKVKSNDSVATTFTVDYGLEFLGTQWRDASNLTVGVCPSAISFFEDDLGLSRSDIIKYAEKWNGINKKVHVTVSEAATETPNTDIKIIAVDEDTGYLDLAYTGIFRNRGYIDGQIAIKLVANHLSLWQRLSTSLQKIAITHEMGHALGLDESECEDKAVMYAYANGPYVSTSITDHDRYNINELYK